MKKLIFVFMLICTVLFFMGYTVDDAVKYVNEKVKKSENKLEISSNKEENGYYLDNIEDKLVKGKSLVCTYKIESTEGNSYYTHVYNYKDDEFATDLYVKICSVHKNKDENLEEKVKDLKKGDKYDGNLFIDDIIASGNVASILLKEDLVSINWENRKEEFTRKYILDNINPEGVDYRVTCVDY